jgi:Flp pilus assembly pilin Flp
MKHNERGQGLTEYALILSLVSVVSISALFAVGGTVGNTFSNIICSIESSIGDCPVSSDSSASSGDSSDNTPWYEGTGSPSDDGGAPADDGGDPSDDGGDPSDDGGAPADDGGDPSDDGGSPSDDGGSGGGGLPGDGGSDDGGSGGSGIPGDSTSGYQYVRLVAESEVNNNNWASAAELNLVDDSGSLISQSGWTLIYTDSQETSGEDGRASIAIDSNNGTIWHTEWSSSSPTHPHEIQIDLGQSFELSAFKYLPRQSGENGRIKDYKFYVSTNAVNWELVAQGTFPNNGDLQTVSFGGDEPAEPDVCDTAAPPSGMVFQFGAFSGSTVSDLSGNGHDASANSGAYYMSNSSAINTSTFNAKTMAVRFTTGGDVNTPQIIYEQGGGSKGMNIYIDNGGVYAGAWTNAGWGVKHLYASVQSNTTYDLVLVFNNPNMALYINGSQRDSLNDAGSLGSHSGGIGVIGKNSSTKFHDGSSGSSSYSFIGSVSAMLQWNSALSGSDLDDLETYLSCS